MGLKMIKDNILPITASAIIIILLFISGCGKETICTCKNETITVEKIVEVPKIEKEYIVVNRTITKIQECNDSIVLSLTRRLKYCNSQQFKYTNATKCEFDLNKLNQTLNRTTILLDEYKYNQTYCTGELKDCYIDLERCEEYN